MPNRTRVLRLLVCLLAAAAPSAIRAAAAAAVEKFQQLDQLLPSPTPQRNAAGAPGPAYWQNRADYDIAVELDDTARRISGSATITYRNRSPDPLAYLWLQLDQNHFAHDADSRAAPRSRLGLSDRIAYSSLDRELLQETYDGTMTVSGVTDTAGRPLPHTVVKTMLRLDLPAPLAPGADFAFRIAWSFPINDMKRFGARTGFEYFPADGNCVYTIAQFFPRLAAYTDYAGWMHKQFLGTGEFTLEFGDYTVRLTVPDDHIVGATGVLQNPDEVLTAAQRERLKQAQNEPKKTTFIVTPDEARAAETGKFAGKKTWVFKAENVRDFAFASSRKFIWDALAVAGATHPPTPERAGGIADRMYRPPVMAMSLYPKEGMPLWDKYSTHAIAHAIEVYGRFSFAYPYPVAWSVMGGLGGGMEYPMICFNGPRPESDGTYTKRTKYGLIGVVIHEVGHNWFPMIVNSDERQWTWMDEGLNSFVQFLAQEEWEKDYPQGRGERGIVDYMRRTDRVPVMTNSESILDLGFNSYAQPTVALNVLREHVLGRELFDHAFKTFSRRWMFKRPTPADFFRTMEDASGTDLDWFWRGWFYGTERVDVSVDRVKWLQLDSRDPAVENPKTKAEKDALPQTLARLRNADLPKRLDRFPELKDFYDDYDEATVLPSDRKKYESLLADLKKAQIDPALLKTARNFYVLEFSNVGGLLTPLILRLDYADGSTEELKIPAEIWRYDSRKATKFLMTPKELAAVTFDPRQELVDCDLENNRWPRQPVKTKFQLFKEEEGRNPMRELTKPAEAKSAEKK